MFDDLPMNTIHTCPLKTVQARLVVGEAGCSQGMALPDMTHQSHHTQLVTFRKFVPHSSPRELLSSYWLLFQIRPVFIGDTEAVQSKWAARLEFAKLKLVERCSDSVGDQAVEEVL